jgi:hypothetical protein
MTFYITHKIFVFIIVSINYQLSYIFSMNVQGPGLEWVVHCGGDGRSPYPVLQNHLTFPGLEEPATNECKKHSSWKFPIFQSCPFSKPRTETGWKAVEAWYAETSSAFREAHALAKYTQNQN